VDEQDIASLHDVPVPLFVIEPASNGDLIYVAFNTAALKATKFVTSDYLGLTARQLFHGEYGEHAYQQHLETYRTGMSTNYELSLPLNGKLQHVRTRLLPVLSNDGRVIRMIGAVTDMNAEIELERFRTQSKNMMRERQEFIYLAAHDLRGPMKKVRMLANILREDFKDMGDGKMEVIDMLEKVSSESIDMVKRVLDHAEISEMEETVEQVSLPEICKAILTTLDPDQKHKSQIDDCSIYGDRLLLNTVLRNLIENAIKHNANKSVLITVSAKNALKGNFTMSVSDDGQGMLYPRRLFESTHANRSKSGFGLLAIRKLIKNRGGDISSDAAANGAGLCITMTLPGTVSFDSKDMALA